MAIHALSLPHSLTAFEPLRHSMAKHLGHRFSSAPTRISPDKSVAGVPKVVYIDRQDTSRHIVPEDDEALVGFLRGMERDGRIRFLHGKFGEMSLEDQVKSVMDADVSSSRVEVYRPEQIDGGWGLMVDHHWGTW